MIAPYYQDNAVTIYHGDARELLPSLGCFDLVLTDPPYGLGESMRRSSTTEWGGNYYALPPSRCWFIWDKKMNDQWTTGQAELAWTNLDRPVRTFRLSQVEAHVEMGTKLHPTQKPESLISWCFAMTRDDTIATVLDPFMGSGTTLRVAKDRGLQAIGIDAEERYCEIAAKRCAQEVLELGA